MDYRVQYEGGQAINATGVSVSSRPAQCRACIKIPYTAIGGARMYLVAMLAQRALQRK